MFHESGRKFSKWVENNVGKGEIAPTVFPTPFPPVFLKKKNLHRRHVKTRASLETVKKSIQQ